jgi:hypothetical protein
MAIRIGESWNRTEIVPGGYIVIVTREIDIINIPRRKDIG